MYKLTATPILVVVRDAILGREITSDGKVIFPARETSISDGDYVQVVAQIQTAKARSHSTCVVAIEDGKVRTWSGNMPDSADSLLDRRRQILSELWTPGSKSRHVLAVMQFSHGDRNSYFLMRGLAVMQYPGMPTILMPESDNRSDLVLAAHATLDHWRFFGESDKTRVMPPADMRSAMLAGYWNFEEGQSPSGTVLARTVGFQASVDMSTRFLRLSVTEPHQDIMMGFKLTLSKDRSGNGLQLSNFCLRLDLDDASSRLDEIQKKIVTPAESGEWIVSAYFAIGQAVYCARGGSMTSVADMPSYVVCKCEIDDETGILMMSIPKYVGTKVDRVARRLLKGMVDTTATDPSRN
jgi:hypothetical protein